MRLKFAKLQLNLRLDFFVNFESCDVSPYFHNALNLTQELLVIFIRLFAERFMGNPATFRFVLSNLDTILKNSFPVYIS